MPFPVCLQDWITVQGYQQSVVVTQTEDQYAEVTGYQDLGVYVEIASNSNATLSVQTAPTKEASYFNVFKNGAGTTWQWTAAGVQPIATMRFADGGTPSLAARFLRWTVTGTGAGAWNISFRIWLNLNQAPGTG
jgi:hypothetical protein